MALVSQKPVNILPKSKIPRKMPRSRRRHHSRSRSRSRSHSYERDREPKRRRIDTYDSPHHRRSLSSDEDREADKTNSESCAETTIGVNQDRNHEKDVLKEVEEKLDTVEQPLSEEGKEKAYSNEEVLILSDNKKEFSLDENDENRYNRNDTCVKAIDEADKKDAKALSLEDCDNKSNSSEEETCTENLSPMEVDNPSDNTDSPDKELQLEKETQKETISGETKQDKDSDMENDGGIHENSGSKITTPNTDVTELAAKIKENLLKNTPGKSMSPRNLQKRVEIELRKEQKRIEKEEKERKKQELKEEKLKQKQEKEEQKRRELEAKQKEKELKEEKKKKEREEKEKKKREKEEQEEQKRKEREQEKVKKQQEIEEKMKEKQKIEEQKQKTAAAFANFFKKRSENLVDGKKTEEMSNSLFMPFEIKSGMKLAPSSRMDISADKKEILINHLEKQEETKLYLQELKEGKPIGVCGKTWFCEDFESNDDVVIIEDTPLGESIIQDSTKPSKIKAKFLKFDENRRPPYYGTWRKRSKFIKPRRPFAQDKEYLDYEVDSDDDWEDEEDAGEIESLRGSDEEEKEASDNEYEVDNEFFVPHGHLSDDEMNNEEDKPMSPETHKAHLKLLKNEFEEEMKSKTQRIKPRIIGCVWQDKDNKCPEEAIQNFLEPLSVICLGPIKIKKRSSIVSHTPVKKNDPPKKKLEKEHVPTFLALIHGNVKKRKFLVNEFLEYLKEKGIETNVSKISLGKELKQLAEWTKCPEEGPMYNKYCWFVPENIRNEYEVELTLPNNWKYTLKKPS